VASRWCPPCCGTRWTRTLPSSDVAAPPAYCPLASGPSSVLLRIVLRCLVVRRRLFVHLLIVGGVVQQVRPLGVASDRNDRVVGTHAHELHPHGVTTLVRNVRCAAPGHLAARLDRHHLVSIIDDESTDESATITAEFHGLDPETAPALTPVILHQSLLRPSAIGCGEDVLRVLVGRGQSFGADDRHRQQFVARTELHPGDTRRCTSP